MILSWACVLVLEITCSSSTLMGKKSGLATMWRRGRQVTCREPLSERSWRERGISSFIHGIFMLRTWEVMACCFFTINTPCCNRPMNVHSTHSNEGDRFGLFNGLHKSKHYRLVSFILQISLGVFIIDLFHF